MAAPQPLEYAGPKRNLANRRFSRSELAFFRAVAGAAALLAASAVIAIVLSPILLDPKDETRTLLTMVGLGVTLVISICVSHAAHGAVRRRSGS